MPTAMITGAGRGLGRELAAQYRSAGWDVIGTVRSDLQAAEIETLGIRVLTADMSDADSLRTLPETLGDTPLDVLICNAGIMCNRHMKITEFDQEAWTIAFSINSIAPALVAGLLLPNLRRGQQKKLIAISSGRASIGNNDSGSTYAYRASKAALNAIWRNISVEEPDIIALLVHPGRVRTDMGNPQSELSVEQSAAAIRTVIEATGPEQSGRFLAFDGSEWPW